MAEVFLSTLAYSDPASAPCGRCAAPFARRTTPTRRLAGDALEADLLRVWR